jgi:anti-sigma factor RsiW
MTDDQQLSDYLLGELDPEARRRMERRIAEDPELRARAESLSPLVSSLQALPPVAWEAIGADRGEPKSTPAPAPHRFRRLTPRVAMRWPPPQSSCSPRGSEQACCSNADRGRRARR